jgi:dTDP-4-amino-4,6-dideoxygalactose transaminase
MEVPLLDLKAQYETIKNEVEEALLGVARSQHFILGPEVEKLEKSVCDYLGCRYAIGVSSGTDALLMALMAIGIKPGDRVIVPTYSFISTAGVVARLKAAPVFVDIDPVTFNIHPREIGKRVSWMTRAIIPVHLFGQSAEMDEILDIAHKHNLKVIEDAAQAIGAQYKDGRKVGTIGDIGCFSFFPSKNLGAFGDGGMVVTNDDELGERLRILRVHGGKPKYYHKVIGGNFRLDAIQAAVLNVKLPYLDTWSEARRKNAELYTSLFTKSGLAEEEGRVAFDEKNKVLLPKAVYRDSLQRNYHIFNQYVIRVERRENLREFLASKGIGTEVYYPVPFHRQECFSYLNSKDQDYPFANSASSNSVALPIYPELTLEQITYVANSIVEFHINR